MKNSARKVEKGWFPFQLMRSFLPHLCALTMFSFNEIGVYLLGFYLRLESHHLLNYSDV